MKNVVTTSCIVILAVLLVAPAAMADGNTSAHQAAALRRFNRQLSKQTNRGRGNIAASRVRAILTRAKNTANLPDAVGSARYPSGHPNVVEAVSVASGNRMVRVGTVNVGTTTGVTENVGPRGIRQRRTPFARVGVIAYSGVDSIRAAQRPRQEREVNAPTVSPRNQPDRVARQTRESRTGHKPHGQR